MNYKVIITYDPEYQGYVVDVPELYGCMSQGKTMDEAMANVKEAIGLWLESEREDGKEYKENKLGDMFIGELTV